MSMRLNKLTVDNVQLTIMAISVHPYLKSFPQGIPSLSIIHYQLSIPVRQCVYVRNINRTFKEYVNDHSQ